MAASRSSDPHLLLSAAEMRAADAGAIAAGIPGIDLMERAGEAVAEAALRRWPGRSALVLCGPGNNGGDGFVAARHLSRAGVLVRLALLGDRQKLAGDAALAASRWQGEVVALSPDLLGEQELVVDALFGAGLARPLDGVARATVETIGARRLDCLAIDVPSGLDGDSGEVLGAAPRSRVTVTFCRAKPGHYLLPGRLLCGELVIADIGIPEAVVAGLGLRRWLNGPWLWRDRIAWPSPSGHKYSRGHVLILGGGQMTGAGRLAARAARRAGAGMTTLLAPAPALPIYAADQPGLITASIGELERYLEDPRISAVLIGPGAGRGASTRRHVLQVLRAGKPAVLDADALTVFASEPSALFEAIHGQTLLTPHEGEFARLFKLQGSKLVRAEGAAKAAGAAVLLKGYDTVVAAPDGRVAINANAPAALATAGAGDVLAGIALALLGQGLGAFEAGAAAAWLHGASAARHGIGLIAEDLPEGLPAVLGELQPG
ncbi:MAG TPA: NAD(P)H-hydrate dehydratase [Dongiaceae bacterium]|nr:NAD(P)H-hydrate dehydratase [Dongiaceae bacterium]